MPRFAVPSWQLILADLALILFLVTLSALAHEEEINARANALLASGADLARGPQVAPSQALYRPTPGGPTLAEWLAARPQDARATLTIFVRYSQGEREALWQEAQELAEDASGEGFAVRVIIAKGATSDVHASLAYDAVQPQLSE